MNVKVLRNVLEANDQLAMRIRNQLAAKKIAAINLISGPGAGKTSLLEKTIPALKQHHRIGVLEGDIATTRDADRIAKLGVPVVQLLTGGACHLEAPLVQRGLGELDLDALDLLFIENVGNIACPAEFDLGEKAKVGILSVTEGHDKPAKYPLLFHEISALVLNKMDLLPYTDFDFDKFLSDFRKLNADAPVFQVSCRTGQGIGEWTHWLEHVAEGEIKIEPHTHPPSPDGLRRTGHAGLDAVIQPHQHPHRQHHTEVKGG
jgi:hydrogenase nickel incorporation protein HypB